MNICVASQFHCTNTYMCDADKVFAFFALVIAAVFSIKESINNSKALAKHTVKGTLL